MQLVCTEIYMQPSKADDFFCLSACSKHNGSSTEVYSICIALLLTPYEKTSQHPIRPASSARGCDLISWGGVAIHGAWDDDTCQAFLVILSILIPAAWQPSDQLWKEGDTAHDERTGWQIYITPPLDQLEQQPSFHKLGEACPLSLSEMPALCQSSSAGFDETHWFDGRKIHIFGTGQAAGNGCHPRQGC